LGGVWFQGKLNGKLGSVFGSTSSNWSTDLIAVLPD